MKFHLYIALLWMGIAAFLPPQALASEDGCTAKELALDHVIYVVPDLAAGAKFIEDLTGVTPTYGGEHSNGVTANYLVALGQCLYMEIVGPKEGLTIEDFGEPRRSTYRTAHVAGFAVRLKLDKDLSLLSEEARLAFGPAVNEGGRAKPDGSRLSWRTTGMPQVKLGPGTFQFAIEWLEGEHPSLSAPTGIELQQLVIAGVGEGLPRLNSLGLVTAHSDAPADLKLVLQTPKGEVTLD